MKLIVKRAGHTELYDERKLYASVYAAALAVREPVGMAEMLAQTVVGEINTWLDRKHEVTSNDIRRKVSEFLHQHNKEASHLYYAQRMLR